MLLSNKLYNTLKWIAQYLLPASGTLYFALATIWGLGYGEQVIGTITAIDIFLGVILGISTAQYKKTGVDGSLQIDTSGESKDIYRISLNTGLENLSNKKTIVLNVENNVDLSK